MPMFEGAYTQGMMNRFGVDVTVGGVTAKALRNEADSNSMGDEWSALVGRALVIQCKTGVFPALADAVAVTVDGVSGYKVAKIEKVGPDGEMTRFTVVKVR